MTHIHKLGVSGLAILALMACSAESQDAAATIADETSVTAEAESTDTAARPNILIIVADDLGYGDIGVNGAELIRTPNIDELAGEGIRFTSGYVTAAVCAPSRAALMTGRHQQSFGYEFNPRGRDDVGIPVEVTTIADRMQAAGYRTGLVGKWHLGETRELHPMSRGFESFYGFVEGGNGYLTSPEQGEWMADPVPGSPQGFKPVHLQDGFEPIDSLEGNLTGLLTDAAVDFIDESDEDPFFLVLTHFAPHSPLQATTEQLEPYKHVEDKATRIYAAMVTAMDEGVGEVIDALERNGLRDDTLVVFMSDNGCAHYIGVGTCSNGDFAGYKGTYFEGGIRVPMIASWPGRLEAGAVYDKPIVSYDWSATALALGGAETEGADLDGVDLMGYIAGDDPAVPHERIHWRTTPNITMRDGDWKLLMIERTDGEGMVTMLFNLAEDPGEMKDLSGKYPQKVTEMRDLFEEWSATMLPPSYESQREASFELPNGIEVTVYN